jgi:hypothetical protein
MLPMSALSSRVPAPSERAGFLSLQSVVQHLASAVGAVASSRLLIAEPSGRLQRFPETAALAALFALAMPLLLWRASRLLSLREGAKAAAG